MKHNKSEDSAQTFLQFGSERDKMSVDKDLLKERIPYFNGMFSNHFQESTQSVIDLGLTVDINSASKLIQFISKGSLKVSGEDIQGVFVLSDLWGMEGLKNVCASFMISEMDSSNCLELLQLAEMHSCTKLKEESTHLICQEFQVVCQTKAFLDLPDQAMISLLLFENLNTGLDGEDCVMKSVIRWYEHDKASREVTLSESLKHVHVDHISQQTLKTLMPSFPVSLVNEIHLRLELHAVSNARHHNQLVIVCCGYSQSRTGPTCPRTCSTEVFDPAQDQFQRTSFPDPPPFGVALNLLGRAVYFTVYVHTAETSSKKTHLSKVFSFKDNVYRGCWLPAEDLFSEKAAECISSCLMNQGSVVHCSKNECIYAIETSRSVCIQVKCTDGIIHCDYKCELPSLLLHLDETHTGIQGVCHNGRLFVLGGFYGPEMERVFSNTVLALSMDGLTWEPRHPMLIPRFGFAVALYKNKLIVSGGYGGHNQKRRHQSCECYDMEKNKWETFASMEQSRSGHCMVVANKTLYVLGGKSYASQKHGGSGSEVGWHPGGARIVSDRVELYEDFSHVWYGITKMSDARCNFQAVVI